MFGVIVLILIGFIVLFFIGRSIVTAAKFGVTVVKVAAEKVAPVKKR